MVLLGTTAVKIVSLQCAEGRAAMASRTALSDVKANYDSYIFEHYHILLFDKNDYGNGEAAIEERIEKLTQDNLGDDYTVNDVQLTDFTMIYDDTCEELKAQIKEQMGYMAVTYSIDKLEDKLGGSEGSYSEALEDEIDEVENMPDTVEKETDEDSDEADNSLTDPGDKLLNGVKDPRKYTSSSARKGMLLSLLLEDESSVSSEDKLPDDIPSSLNSVTTTLFNINTDFDNYSDLKSDMKKGNSWGSSLTEKGESVLYAANVFNSYTEKVNSENVMDCEMEYIIAGKQTDYENLEAVCKKILAIRMPVDMAYLVTDVEKMTTIKTLSVPIAAATPFITEPVIRYLIAAAWSYAEAMAETRNLLAGNKLDFVKKKGNWITNLDNLGGSVEKTQNSENGISYKEYLMLLMAMEGDDMYYRMLDVMDVNARKSDSSFRMLNAAVGLSADFDISYQGGDVSVHQSSSYDR
jgi:hypothetical protein